MIARRPGRRRAIAIVLTLATVLGGLAGFGYARLSALVMPSHRAVRADAAQRSIIAATIEFAPGRSLDVWTPVRRPSSAPVIVMVHSCCGDRADLGKLAEAAAAAGAVVFNADWAGIRPGSHLASAYGDIACALADAEHVAARFGGDRRSLALLGWGDGAMAAAVVAARPGAFRVAGCEANSGSEPPRAFVGIAGFYGWPVSVPARYVSSRSVDFIGGPPARAALAWRSATPYSVLTSRHVECTTLLVGQTDLLRLDADRFAWALRRAGARVQLIVAPNAGDQSMISPRTQEGRATVRATLAAARCGGRTIRPFIDRARGG